MRTKFLIAGFVASALLAPAIGFAAEDHDKDRTNASAFVKDSAITVKVKSKLAAEHLSSLGTIRVDTDANGIVFLSGTARSQEQIDQAVSIARKTERVRGVDSRLTIKKDD